MALSANDLNPSNLAAKLNLNSGWMIFLGIVMIALGIVALIYAFASTVVSVVFFGFLMLIAGLMQLAHAWNAKGWKSVLYWTLSGLLYLVASIIAITNPVAGAVALTLVLGAFLIASGIFRVWAWFQSRETEGSGWLAFSGLVTLLVGLLIAGGWPGNSIWILGLILGVDLIAQGWAALLVGFAVKRIAQ